MNEALWRNSKITGLALTLMFVATPLVRANTTIFTDPFAGSGGDDISRGFYISSYPGTNLDTVTLAYTAGVTGSYTTSLTARIATYNGTIIGTTQTVTTTLSSSGETQVTYNFGGAAVPAGSLVTFTQVLVSGPGFIDYDLGTGASGVTETEGTTPPLDVFRRSSVGVIITQQGGVPPTPAPTTLILVLTGLVVAGLYAAHRRPRTI